MASIARQISIKLYAAKYKTSTLQEQRTDTIYSIPCNDCDEEYIGQTKRQFGKSFERASKSGLLLLKRKLA